jgi:hypothetical protein
MPNEVPADRWQIVTVDLITDLPRCQGFDCIWVCVDRFSKHIHIAPTTKELDSVGHARLFRDHVWRHHGLPSQVISDCGTQFVQGFTRDLNRLLGIEGRASTAFHPQTDGQTERVNQEIEQYLRMFINHHQDDWAEWLPLAEFAYNNRVHSSTRRSPFEIDNGTHPRMGVEPRRQARVEAANEFAGRMGRVLEETRAALKQAASDMTRFYDTDHREAEVFEVGEKVWLDGRHIKTQRPMKKFDDRWFGPFRVQKVLSRNAYRLTLPHNFRHIHPVFHVSILRCWHPDPIAEHSQPDQPEPLLADNGEPEYEDETILDSRMHYRKLQYLVRWKGYGSEHNSWEPADNLANAPELIAEFHRTNPSAPRRLSAASIQSLMFRRYEALTEAPLPPQRWEDGSTRRVAES